MKVVPVNGLRNVSIHSLDTIWLFAAIKHVYWQANNMLIETEPEE